jgi:hypothetical protein
MILAAGSRCTGVDVAADAECYSSARTIDA